MLPFLTMKKNSSPLNKQLRSPRGSPRNNGNRSPSLSYYVARHFRYLFLCSFPLLLVLQWSMSFVPNDSLASQRHDLSFLNSLESSRQQPAQTHHVRTSASASSSTMNVHRIKDTKHVVNDTLGSYNYAYNPIVPASLFIPHSNTPLPVVLLGTSATRNVNTSIILDGLERSRYIKVINSPQDWEALKRNPNQAVVHMVDWMALERDCHYLEDMYEDVIQPMSHQLVYFDSSKSPRVTTCPQINDLFRNRYRVVKQSIVKGRHWNPRKQWTSLGHVPENSITGAGPVLHSPHFLREQFVDMVSQALNTTGEELSQIVSRHRKLDVLHIWRKGDASHYGFLRRQGDEEWIEKAFVQPEYVVTLLSSKIVVVAQRDEWEDHFRLMESLASGALVLTDIMLATPHGLKNGTHLITYHDAESLRKMILHYAHPDCDKERRKIAKSGWQVAMGKHRSWHRMEQLLFGGARTHADRPLEPAPPRQLKKP